MLLHAGNALSALSQALRQALNAHLPLELRMEGPGQVFRYALSAFGMATLCACTPVELRGAPLSARANLLCLCAHHHDSPLPSEALVECYQSHALERERSVCC